MKSMRWVLVLLGLSLGAAEAKAQGLLVPVYPASGVSFTYSRRHFSFALNSYSYGGYAVAPCAPFIGSQVTVIYGIAPPPPLIVVPRRLFLGEDDLVLGRRVILPEDGGVMIDDTPPQHLQPNRPLAGGADPAEAPLPGQPAGRFRPLKPDDRARAQQPIPPEPLPVPPEKKPPQDKPKPDPVPVPPPLPRNDPDPRAQQASHVEQGKQAFTAGAYGRAAQHFRQATLVLPDRPEAYFLLAQAFVALGKYRDAADAVHTGLRLEPGWPLMRYRPLELYGPNVVDYTDHLRTLEKVLDGLPNDPDLLFLYAYQLWFDGRKEEACIVFQRASRFATEKADSERFLRAFPAVPNL